MIESCELTQHRWMSEPNCQAFIPMLEGNIKIQTLYSALNHLHDMCMQFPRELSRRNCEPQAEFYR